MVARADVHLADRLTATAPGIAREFVFTRSNASEHATWGTMVGSEERALAEKIVGLASDRVADRRSVQEALDMSEDLGARTAALGLSAADLIAWIRAIEILVSDSLKSIQGVDEATRARAGAVILMWFDELRAYHLDVYESAHNQLAGWFTKLGADLLTYLTSGEPIDANLAGGQARALGIEPNQRFQAVALKIDADAPRILRARIRSEFAGVLGSFQPGQSLLARELGDVLTALVPTGEDDDLLARRLNGILSEPQIGGSAFIAVGEVVESLFLAGRSYLQARSALHIAIYRETVGSVTRCSDVMVEVLLAHNTWVARRMVDTRLAEIVDSPQLLDTLRTYIDCDMVLQRTAEALSIHSNTVAYRLRQISTRTGRDMRRITDLADLAVALTALDVIRASETTSSQFAALDSAPTRTPRESPATAL